MRHVTVYTSDLFDMSEINLDRLANKLRASTMSLDETAEYLTCEHYSLFLAEMSHVFKQFRREKDEYSRCKNTLQFEWLLEKCGWTYDDFVDAYIDEGWTRTKDYRNL